MAVAAVLAGVLGFSFLSAQPMVTRLGVLLAGLIAGVAQLPDGVEMVMPGDNTQMTVELIAPIAMEKGLRFAIREGGRTVGAGVVADIIA